MLRIDEAAEMLGVCEMTVRRWVAQGVIRGTKIGGCVRVHASSINEAIEAGAIQPNDDKPC
jgi:excisionase family DNA binding protein